MKLGNLYDLNSYQNKFLKSAELQKSFCDAQAGILIKENLKHINQRIFEKKYPELVFLNSGLAGDNSGGYALIIESMRVQPTGEFKTTGDKDANKGKISITAENSLIKVLEREAESSWSDSELQTGKLQGINIQEKYVSSHTMIYQREVDEIVATGIPNVVGSTGLLNNSHYSATGASDLLDDLTAVQLYNEFAALIRDQWNIVANTPEYMANNVIMPTKVYNKLSSDILNSAGSERSVLAALMFNFPQVKFSTSFRCDDVGGSSKTVAYNTNEESAIIRIPIPLTMSEIAKQAFKYHVESKYRIAGLDILESTSGRILTGL